MKPFTFCEKKDIKRKEYHLINNWNSGGVIFYRNRLERSWTYKKNNTIQPNNNTNIGSLSILYFVLQLYKLIGIQIGEVS